MATQVSTTVVREREINILKRLGGTQLGLGIFCVIFSLVGIIMDAFNQNDSDCRDFYNMHYGYGSFQYANYLRCRRFSDAPTLLGLDITSFIISGWCIMTGLLPFCMTTNRRNKWRCLKISFMVCCIIGASLFIAAMFGMGIVASFLRVDIAAIVPGIFSFCAFVEFVIAIITASFCCCCSSPLGSGAQVNPGYVFMTNTETGAVVAVPSTQIPGSYSQTAQGQATYVPCGHLQMMLINPQTGQYVGNPQIIPNTGNLQLTSSSGQHQMIPFPGNQQMTPSPAHHQMIQYPGNQQMMPTTGHGQHTMCGPFSGNPQMMSQYSVLQPQPSAPADNGQVDANQKSP